MKKVKALLLMISIGWLSLNAQENTGNANPVDPNAPVITFETEVIDYGTIEQGADGTREFKFKNTGKSPLIISSARGSCGCTVPSWPTEPIKPGESGIIKVSYDTKRLGPINKTVTVYSNASEPTKILRIKGNVVAPATTPEKPTPQGAPVEN